MTSRDGDRDRDCDAADRHGGVTFLKYLLVLNTVFEFPVVGCGDSILEFLYRKWSVDSRSGHRPRLSRYCDTGADLLALALD